MSALITRTPIRRPGRAELLAGAGLALTNQASGTNRAVRRPRFNEAELVRERREGISEADMTALGEREPEKPMVTDPALARALDLLKGLALVRQVAFLISRLTILLAEPKFTGSKHG